MECKSGLWALHKVNVTCERRPDIKAASPVKKKLIC